MQTSQIQCITGNNANDYADPVCSQNRNICVSHELDQEEANIKNDYTQTQPVSSMGNSTFIEEGKLSAKNIEKCIHSK